MSLIYKIFKLKKKPWLKYWLYNQEKAPTPILPKEYQQVDYIESSGTQYIDTGVKTSNNMKVITKVISTFGLTNGAVYYSYCLVGGRKGAQSSAFYYNSGASNDYIGNGNNYLIIPKNNKTDFLDLEYSNTKVSITCGTYSYSNNSLNITITEPYNIFIFANNNGDEAINLGTYKLFSFKMYENDILVRDFVPCYRKSDNVVGLYDAVNNVFYTNAGTGAFTKGSDV